MTHDLHAELLEQCRINGMGAEREAALLGEIERLKKALLKAPAIPDALTSADIQEHPEYVSGWNDCRQTMAEIAAEK